MSLVLVLSMVLALAVSMSKLICTGIDFGNDHDRVIDGDDDKAADHGFDDGIGRVIGHDADEAADYGVDRGPCS